MLFSFPLMILAFKKINFNSSRQFCSHISSKTIEIELELKNKVENLGLNKIGRHIFLCADQTNPKCCKLEEGIASWDFLKVRLRELNLIGPKAKENNKLIVARSKVNCLQICKNGPLCVIYPGNFI